MRAATTIAFCLAAFGLAGCKPELGVEEIARRTFTFTNLGNGDLRIERIVVNDGDGRAECEQAPGVTLGPGRSHSVTFFDCGAIEEIDLDTDRGGYDFAWDASRNQFR
jgi:hypothetical protein